MTGSGWVLVLNAGSSSLKYSVVDGRSGDSSASGLVERIGEPAGRLRHQGPGGEHRVERPVADHADALEAVLTAFAEQGPDLATAQLAAVGHRVVHGGSRFAEPVLVDDALLSEVTDLVPLAPLHNPANLEALKVARDRFPELPQVAVFDTAFHQTLPPQAYTYAVPRSWLEEHRIRRYGFHGTSHQFVSREAARILGRDPDETNVIVLHLGNGASATAVRGGRSVDTSMGLTPLEGLVMGTRSGDVDPALHAHLHRSLGWTLDQVDAALNRESGLRGLCGDNDFRVIEQRRRDGDEAAQRAFEVYCYRIRGYVGAYYAVLGRVDAVVFTAGVGEHNPSVRAAALAGLDRLGIVVDDERNDAATGGSAEISPDGAEVRVLVVPTDEEWEIARQALDVVERA